MNGEHVWTPEHLAKCKKCQEEFAADFWAAEELEAA